MGREPQIKSLRFFLFISGMNVSFSVLENFWTKAGVLSPCISLGTWYMDESFLSSQEIHSVFRCYGLDSGSPSTHRKIRVLVKDPTIRLSKLAAVTPFCKAWKSTRAEFSKVTRKFSYRLTVKDQGWIALGQGPNRISVVKHLGPGSGPRTDGSQIKRNQQQTQKPR